MKPKLLFLLFMVLVSVSMVQAAGFSPSSLTFDLEKGQEECKMVRIDSKSEKVTASDSWAKNESVEWKVSSFNTEAGQHEISINYDDELSLDEREVEVCLSGNKLGEYHGVLLFEEKQQGNSIVQLGVWLKVLINEKPSVSEASSSSGGSGGSGGGGGGGIIVPKGSTNLTNSTNNIVNENAGQIAESEVEENEQAEEENYLSKITGRVISAGENSRNLTILGLVILAIAGLVIYNKRKNQKIK